MARKYADYKYETDNGTVLFTRMQIAAKDAFAANVEPSGSVDVNIRVDANLPSRENGIKPRQLVLTRTEGTGVNETIYTSSLVKLTSGSSIPVGTEATYNGFTWKVAGFKGEEADSYRPLSAEVV